MLFRSAGWPENGHLIQQRFKPLGNRGSPQGTAKNADQGDADLNSGKKIVRGVGESEGFPRLAIAPFRQLLKPYFSCGNNGDLRSREDSICYLEEKNQKTLADE